MSCNFKPIVLGCCDCGCGSGKNNGNQSGVSGPSTNTGEIFWWPLTTPPAGSLYCDGSAVSRTEYENLFNVIGTGFGEGDGETTFNLPDLRGEFVRGYDPEALRDPSGLTRKIGKHQESTRVPYMRAITTAAGNRSILAGFNAELNTSVAPTNPDAWISGTSTEMSARYISTDSDSGILEKHYTVRPTNVNLLPCVRH